MRYRVKEVPHYIGGKIRKPGEIVTLPDNIKAGRYLEKVSKVEAEKPAKPATPASADEADTNFSIQAANKAKADAAIKGKTG